MYTSRVFISWEERGGRIIKKKSKIEILSGIKFLMFHFIKDAPG